jgi:hypothetical protein
LETVEKTGSPFTEGDGYRKFRNVLTPVDCVVGIVTASHVYACKKNPTSLNNISVAG